MSLAAVTQPRDRRLRRGSLLVATLVATTAACMDTPPASSPGRPLRLGLYGAPSTLDPHLQDDYAARTVLANVCDGLVFFDSEMRILPALAATWENPDDLTWRFHLRPGVTFHDGSTLDSGDVVASLERARNHPESRVSGLLVALEKVEALDDATVEVHTAKPYPILLNKLALVPIVPAGAPARIEVPIGTGPYRIVRQEPERVELAAVASYWGGAPVEQEVELRVVADPEERLAALERGELDVVLEVPPGLAEEVEQHPETRLAARSSLVVVYLALHLGRPPFDDPRVRRAIDVALDRPALVRELAEGHGEAIGQVAPPNVFGFSPDLLPPARDLALARRLLAEAGYPDGLDLELEHREGREAAAIVRQLGEAGIRVRDVVRSWETMYPRLVAGEAPFYLGAWLSVSGDVSDLLDQRVHSIDAERGYGSNNSNGYANPELDLLIETSGTTLNMVERRTALQRALGIVAEDRALLPLYAPFDLYGVRNGVHFEPRLDSRLMASEIHR